MFYISNLGPLEYEKALEIQEKLRQKCLEGDKNNYLLLTEHEAVFTMGRRDSSEDLLNKKSEIPLYKINRGGRITYHGPGQLVGYFIASLHSLKMNIPQFVNAIEELLILVLKEYGLHAQRNAEYPGVWVGDEKIAALGLHFDKGISMHGFSLNLSPNLSHYQNIIPCGIVDKGVTSLEKLTGKKIACAEVIELIFVHLKKIFKCEIVKINEATLLN